jgi:hypothetical protein
MSEEVETVVFSHNTYGEPVANFTFNSRSSSIGLTEIQENGKTKYYVGLAVKEQLHEESRDNELVLPFNEMFSAKNGVENAATIILFKVDNETKIEPLAFLSGNFEGGVLIPNRITYLDGRSFDIYDSKKIDVDNGKIAPDDGEYISKLYNKDKEQIQSAISPDMQKALMLAGQADHNFESAYKITPNNPQNNQTHHSV